MKILTGRSIDKKKVLTQTGELIHFEEKHEIMELLAEERKLSFKEGEKKGERAGYEKAHKEMHVTWNLLQLIANKIIEKKTRLFEELKPEVIELSFKICEKIIRKELSKPETLAKLINSLLSAASSTFKKERLEIFLSPADMVMLEKDLSTIQIGLKEAKGIGFHSDPLMNAGDVRIENSTSLLNYAIGRELSNLQSKIFN